MAKQEVYNGYKDLSGRDEKGWVASTPQLIYFPEAFTVGTDHRENSSPTATSSSYS
jgi:hypothetical protein